MQRLMIMTFTDKGYELANRICDASKAGKLMSDSQATAPAEISAVRVESGRLNEITKNAWNGGYDLLFISAVVIAVRAIAPHVRSKTEDPAVVVTDEKGRFVIPILSGHIGGANELARRLSEKLGALAVVTTATDINNRFSVDAWAAAKGYTIDDLGAAKAVSAAILEGDVPMLCQLPVAGAYPAGVTPGESGKTGILVGWSVASPFDRTLRIIPKALRLGIGCRRGVTAETIEAAVSAVLSENAIDRRAVKSVSSIDLKADEAGLLEFCEKNGWPAEFHSAARLAAVEGNFTPSAFVKSVTGVDNVCERAALLGAKRLLVKKTARGGVTVAVAVEDLEVHFE